MERKATAKEQWALPLSPSYLRLKVFCRVLCIPTFLAQTFQEKIFCFNVLIPFLIYVYLETQLIIVFQGILYTNIFIAV